MKYHMSTFIHCQNIVVGMGVVDIYNAKHIINTEKNTNENVWLGHKSKLGALHH